MTTIESNVQIAAGLMGLFVLATGVAHAADVKTEIEAANQQMSAVYGKGDAAGVAALYTTDGQVMPVASEPVKGTAAIQKFWQGAMGAGVAGVSLKTLEVYSAGMTATEVGEYDLTDKSGKKIDHGKYIVVWRKADGHWKLLRDIFSTNAAPAK
jgi:uncharacterized protein (TIGR02246 family)